VARIIDSAHTRSATSPHDPITASYFPRDLIASGSEAGVGAIFRPVQVFASAYADAVKAQQQAWSVLLGTARGTRESSRS